MGTSDLWNLKSDVRSLKFKIPIQNSNQYFVITTTQQNLKWPPKNSQNLVQRVVLVGLQKYVPVQYWVIGGTGGGPGY